MKAKTLGSVQTVEELRALIRDHIERVGCPLCGGGGVALISVGGVARREPCPNECPPPVAFGATR